MNKFTYNTVFIVDDNKTSNFVHRHLLRRISVADEIRDFTNPIDTCSLFSANYETLDVIVVTSSIDERELQRGSEYPMVTKVITKPLKGSHLSDFV